MLLLKYIKNIENKHMNHHKDFILSPITKILEEASIASSGIGNGIETHLLCDYMMQSIFLKMTGFQEQKMKCISWELANNDYEYRYEFTRNPLGECSSYKEKQLIYRNIIKLIKKHLPGFNPQNDIDKIEIVKKSTSVVADILLNTNLSIWAEKNYNDHIDICKVIKPTHFANDENNLFTEINNGFSLRKIYDDYLYISRNRCAHNTQSYQHNLPTLKKLSNDDYKYENYYVWFVVLTLIDNLFMELYSKYLDEIGEIQGLI